MIDKLIDAAIGNLTACQDKIGRLYDEKFFQDKEFCEAARLELIQAHLTLVQSHLEAVKKSSKSIEQTPNN